MNKLSFVFAIAVSALLVACTDNTINEPTSHLLSSTSVKNSITGVTIPIDGIVFLGNQEGTNNQFTVTGEVLYNLTQLSGNYEISLSTSASLKPLSGSQSVLTVQGQSTEYLVVTGDERIAFQKGYEVEGEDGDRLMFSIDFSFADEKLTLDGISLTSVN